MSERIDSLLNRIDDAELRSALAAEFAEVSAEGKVGLVFEHHLPETVTLRHVRPRRGLKARLAGEPEGRLLEVVRVRKGIATCIPQRQRGEDDFVAETVQHPVDDLVTVAEFGDPIFPGLREINRVAGPGADPLAPAHVVINAENHHALQALQYTHAEAVDCIYIDPPYNLGGDLTYNDRRIGKEDQFRHSFWLSFMERRLQLAKVLLKPTGIIIVAIDDTEQAHLKLLMDQVFHESNFIANVIWQGGRKNDSRYVSVGHDYMLIYARDEGALRDTGTRWREPRPAQAEMLAAARRSWDESGRSPEVATQLMKKWIRSLEAGHPAKANNRFYEFDPETGRVFRKDNVSWPGGGGPRYDVLHPITGLPVKVPGSGWRYPNPARMQEMIDQGRILFGKDHTEYINRKLYLDEAEAVTVESVFHQKRTSAATALSGVLGAKRFSFPKDASVLARWIGIVTQSSADAVILDFFAGSGSTAQAVMELNAADGGHRQSILVTNNEVDEKTAKKLAKQGLEPGEPEYEKWGIFERVTKPRIETIVTGTREDGSTYSDGLAETAAFYELTYQDPERVRIDAAYEAVAPLLWLKAGGRGEVIAERDPRGYSATEHYGVLHEVDQWRGFVEELAESVTDVFVVTDSTSAYSTVAAALPSGVQAMRLWSNYLNTFEINQAD